LRLPTSAALLLAAALAGCANMSDAECRDANWYALGFRDGILHLQPQDTVYSHLCEKQGAKVDVALYSRGWTEGKYEADQRNKEPTY